MAAGPSGNLDKSAQELKELNHGSGYSERSKVAILVTDGFEKVELTEPRKALDEAGAETRIVSPKSDRVRSWNFTDWDQELTVDVNAFVAES
jgi:putative intracellular protease/amidase